MSNHIDDTRNLRERAKLLKLCGLLAHWDEMNPAMLGWATQLIEWEESERNRRGLERRLRQARLGRFKALADFDWNWPEQIDRKAVEELMTLSFIGEAGNAVLVGSNGIGKTTVAKNIAYQAVLAGHSAVFISAADMLNDLAAQDGDNALRRKLKYYAQPALLAIDEVGYLSYGNRHADLLFEVISRRYEKRATLVTTNRPFSEWNEVFPNAACVVSLIDRLIHHAEIIAFEGPSYRLREAKERAKRKGRKTPKTDRQNETQNPGSTS